MGVTITFLGAAGTVTGSKYLVEGDGKRILIDCGMFQGDRRWQEENWTVPAIDLGAIDAVLLTHAHIDHVGVLPRYVKQGLRAPVYCSDATAALTSLLLLDSGRLQEEEASYRAERGASRHTPPLPLYTEADAQVALKQLRTVPFHSSIEVAPGVSASWKRMGHILGAGSIQLSIGGRVITFSGDIGRYTVPILKDPEPAQFGDLLLIESTYADRTHAEHESKETLGAIIRETVKRKGVVVIPSFAVGRTQLLLYYLRELKSEGAIPDVPVIIDSPMAQDATELYRRYPDDYDEAALKIVKSGGHPFSFSKLAFTRSREDSIRLNGIDEPMILISASGMLSGGRILHHLVHRLGDPRNTILFVGFQPKGGRGDLIQSGAKSISLFGKSISIRAQVAQMSGLSAHADRDELLRWCQEGQGTPGKVAVVHGEPRCAQIFQQTLAEKMCWNVAVPEYRATWEV